MPSAWREKGDGGDQTTILIKHNSWKWVFHSDTKWQYENCDLKNWGRVKYVGFYEKTIPSEVLPLSTFTKKTPYFDLINIHIK
jgi:hypothetical protein